MSSLMRRSSDGRMGISNGDVLERGLGRKSLPFSLDQIKGISQFVSQPLPERCPMFALRLSESPLVPQTETPPEVPIEPASQVAPIAPMTTTKPDVPTATEAIMSPANTLAVSSPVPKKSKQATVSSPVPKKSKQATVSKSKSKSPVHANSISDDDEIAIVSVRKIPGSTNKPQGKAVKVKQEPGTSTSKPPPATKRRLAKPKSSSQSTQAAGKRPNAIFNPPPAPSEPDSTPMPNATRSHTVSYQINEASNPDPSQSMSSLQAEMDEVESLIPLLPPGPSENELPPAYTPPPRSIEQIIQEQNAALEERIYKRIAQEFKPGSKRNRTALTLEEAETNLKQASAEYAKAKTAEDRKATKKGKRKGPDDDEDMFGNTGSSGKGKNEKGGKGGFEW